MPTETTNHGRSAEEIVEAGAGGLYHRAIYLAELDSASYGVEEEFGYDDNEAAAELVRLVKELRSHLERLSITENAELTLNRTCPACGGAGTWDGKGTPCEDCEGSGAASRDSDLPKEPS